LDQGEVLIDGDDGCILTVGPMAYTALEARRHVQRTVGKHLAVVDARSAKPLDREIIAAQLRRQPVAFTLEDHVRAGGFGSAVNELAATMIAGRVAPIIPLALPDRFIDHGERAEQLRVAGLDVGGVRETLERFLNGGSSDRRN
jgi:1-deoxy-D-xylulose-5-phosphate synthase